MNKIIYIVGLVVVVLAILSFSGWDEGVAGPGSTTRTAQRGAPLGTIHFLGCPATARILEIADAMRWTLSDLMSFRRATRSLKRSRAAL